MSGMMTEAKTSKNMKGNSIENAIAGSLAGVFTKASVQPLDFIRTRLQVHAHETTNIIKLCQNVLKQEGVTSFYKGLSANLLGSGINWGVYFGVYESLKRSLNETVGNHKTDKLSSAHHFIFGIMAASIGICITNPIWCVKTRLQVQSNNITGYKGVFDAFNCIIKEEGVISLYKGLKPALILTVNPALQITFYEQFKRMFIYFKSMYSNINDESILNSQDFLIMGALAKMCSSTVTYPIHLLRARLFQVERNGLPNEIVISKYSGVFDAMQKTYQYEGFTGFYKGLSANYLKTVPASALTFFFYENIMRIIN